jgi:hypothetical protein
MLRTGKPILLDWAIRPPGQVCLESPEPARRASAALKEPLNNSARSAFWSERPQIVRCNTSDSSRSYGRVAQRSRCGLSGKTHTGRAFAGPPPRLDSLIWNDQTTLAQAKPEPPAKAPSRPWRVTQRLLNRSVSLFPASGDSVSRSVPLPILPSPARPGRAGGPKPTGRVRRRVRSSWSRVAGRLPAP